MKRSELRNFVSKLQNKCCDGFANGTKLVYDPLINDENEGRLINYCFSYDIRKNHQYDATNEMLEFFRRKFDVTFSGYIFKIPCANLDNLAEALKDDIFYKDIYWTLNKPLGRNTYLVHLHMIRNGELASAQLPSRINATGQLFTFLSSELLMIAPASSIEPEDTTYSNSGKWLHVLNKTNEAA